MYYKILFFVLTLVLAVSAFHQDERCPKPNEMYSSCANYCTPICGAVRVCLSRCVPGCDCKLNYVRYGDKCIREKLCQRLIRAGYKYEPGLIPSFPINDKKQ